MPIGCEQQKDTAEKGHRDRKRKKIEKERLGRKNGEFKLLRVLSTTSDK